MELRARYLVIEDKGFISSGECLGVYGWMLKPVVYILLEDCLIKYTLSKFLQGFRRKIKISHTYIYSDGDWENTADILIKSYN